MSNMNHQGIAVLKRASAIIAMIAAGSTLTMASTATAATLMVTVENLAAPDGVVLTPLWVGFHDGNFDLFNLGESASSSVERIAEDGNTAPLTSDFLSSGNGIVEGDNPHPLCRLLPIFFFKSLVS
ncbi:MAG: hypothetical protein F6K58_19325 [Symploca sp. SIO2E9]|nr:hypothetical protein [Symploca sp. SIO2E9]